MQTANLSAEQYQGVKFTTKYLSSKLPDSSLYRQFAQWCRIFSEEGLAPEHETGSFGNMSFRLHAGASDFVITRTSAALKSVAFSDFVCVSRCDFETLVIEVAGQNEPSSETFIHAKLYEALPQVNAIFHGHSDVLLANATIPVTPSEIPYGTLELMEAALQLKSSPVFNLRNHGFFSTAVSMDIAGKQVLSLL